MSKRKEAVIQFMDELNRIPKDRLNRLINFPYEINGVFQEYYPDFQLQKKECLEIRILLKELFEKWLNDTKINDNYLNVKTIFRNLQN